MPSHHCLDLYNGLWLGYDDPVGQLPGSHGGAARCGTNDARGERAIPIPVVIRAIIIWAPPILLHILTMSVMLGVLAHASGSLIPGIFGHTVMDIPNFAYWWTDVAGIFDNQPIAETGVGAHFVEWALIFVAAVALFSWAAHKTLVARRKT